MGRCTSCDGPTYTKTGIRCRPCEVQHNLRGKVAFLEELVAGHDPAGYDANDRRQICNDRMHHQNTQQLAVYKKRLARQEELHGIRKDRGSEG